MTKYHNTSKRLGGGKRRKSSSHRTHEVKEPFYKQRWFIIVAVLAVIGIVSPHGKTGNHSSNVMNNNSTKNSSVHHHKDDAPNDNVEKSSSVSSQDNTTKDDAENHITKAEKKAQTLDTVPMGQPLRVGDVEYVVNSRNVADKVGGDFINKKANGVYLIVNVTVKNLGDKSLSVRDDFFKLLKDDKEYESDGTAGMYLNEDSQFFLSKINPDGELTGDVVFDVTQEMANDTSLKLQVQTGTWGTQKGLIDLNQ